jgi:FkbM family methyltransferase
MTALVQTKSAFDQTHYLAHIEARGQLIRRLVPELTSGLGLNTALDAGCGLGFFASLLRECGLEVKAFDGRENNVEEARKRYPAISFQQGDVEDISPLQLGSFDLVLCFGLLYHLENPLRAIRNLRAMTGKVLLLESMCLPQYEPIVLLREEPSFDDQSLTDLAFYASEGCIVKMLYRAGYIAVYRVAVLPDHDDFRETEEHTRRRTVLVAALEPLTTPGLVPLCEPPEAQNPWEKRLPSQPTARQRVKRFLMSPAKQKYLVLARRFHRSFPGTAVPVPLPFGAWWFARNDHVSQPMMNGGFESDELRFVQRFLQPGMTVLDVGAHHGLYTLLASKRVGSAGSVTSFEPSTRERNALFRNLKLNRTKNVRVESIALGSSNAQSDFFVVDHQESGCNSLRPPATSSTTSTTQVQVRRLDDWATERQVDHADFIKLDVEGGELEFLRGAERFLTGDKRPVILAEVQDIRTQPWGYPAREIIRHLHERNFVWFRMASEGRLEPLDITVEKYDGNFVAVPNESLQLIHEDPSRQEC